MAAPPLPVYDTLCYMLPRMPDWTIKISLIVLALCIATLAFAQEPVGCDKFKWPLDKERATLTGSDLPKVDSGSRINWRLPFATIVALVPLAEAKLQSITSTGARGCDGVRKSVKFDLVAAPFTIELSGIEANTIGIAISSE